MSFFRKSTPTISSILRNLRSKSPPTPPPHQSPTFSRFSNPNPPIPPPFSPRSNFVRWRHDYVDRDRVVHFKRRGGHRRWSMSPRTMFIVGAVGTAGFVTVYYGNLETVPYTKRNRLILLSANVERQLGESQFQQLKDGLKGNILPPIHPDSIRVQMISKQIIESLQRGLRHSEKVWSDMEYASEVPGADDGDGQARVSGVWAFSDEGGKKAGEVGWSDEDEVLDDKWVEKSREESRGQGDSRLLATHHLEGLNWEVLVVRVPMINAMCMPGGKIVVFTGLLEHFRTDAEIAVIIGHEVGHAVARHVAEGITKNLWFFLIQLIVLQFVAMPDLVNAMSNILLRFPFSRRMEMEADYIGLLLMASAGYDPRVAPKTYEKLGKVVGDTELKNYLSTHPSSRKRAELLSQAHVMEEALDIYREARAGHGIQGFL